MRSSFPSRDELSAMPLSRLRNMDIQDKEEEDLVQEIVSAKVKNSPPSQPVYRGDVPDIKTAEDEVKWQKIIDERTAKLKGEIPSEEVLGTEPEVSVEATPEVLNIPEETPQGVSQETPKAKGCSICGSKGRRHKKACPEAGKK